jgi:hypothetical protein
MNTFIQKLTIKPYQIFLIDGIGAAASTAFLLLLLVPLQPYFGLPLNLLYVLGIIAGWFMFFSLSCYFLKPLNRSIFLRAVIIFNSVYACITGALLLMHLNQLTTLGFLYFIGEIAVLVILVYIEVKVAAADSFKQMN